MIRDDLALGEAEDRHAPPRNPPTRRRERRLLPEPRLRLARLAQLGPQVQRAAHMQPATRMRPPVRLTVLLRSRFGSLQSPLLGLE